MKSLSVSIEETATPEQVEEVRALLAEVGLDAEVEASYMTKSLTVVAIATLTIVAGGFLQQAGADAYERLRDGAIKLVKRKHSPEQAEDLQVIIEDADSGVIILGLEHATDEGVRELERYSTDFARAGGEWNELRWMDGRWWRPSENAPKGREALDPNAWEQPS